ncbi:hypothetical protein M9H77_32043 [Catharanthus roseus]|uniref:Uncharacterized protein n=1 Tax=Catharanthus roseus TaxID=4058 RepID=A0ACC0A5P0_CATRO|nr:hypothetical protein M9H77_32043 [Catharanthus roseus]
MVRLGGRRGDDDLRPVTDKTGRVHGRTVTTPSRGTRGRHSTSDLPATPTPLALGFHHGTGAPGSSTQPLAVPFRSQPPLQLHLSYTLGFEGNRGLGEEHDRVHALHIEGEADEGGDYGGDDDQDEGEDAGDEEQPMPVAPVAHANGFDGRSRHEKGKGLTGSFISMMSKISGSRNKRTNVTREVPAPTQRRKKVKSSDWEQTSPGDGGPFDPELIRSYGGHVADPIWGGHDRGSLKCRSRYMALIG